jgi:hypothetical protein
MQILQLEKRLQDQFQVRWALEKALGYRTSSHESMSELSMPKVNPCHNNFMGIEIVVLITVIQSEFIQSWGLSAKLVTMPTAYLLNSYHFFGKIF